MTTLHERQSGDRIENVVGCEVLYRYEAGYKSVDVTHLRHPVEHAFPQSNIRPNASHNVVINEK